MKSLDDRAETLAQVNHSSIRHWHVIEHVTRKHPDSNIASTIKILFWVSFVTWVMKNPAL